MSRPRRHARCAVTLSTLRDQLACPPLPASPSGALPRTARGVIARSAVRKRLLGGHRCVRDPEGARHRVTRPSRGGRAARACADVAPSALSMLASIPRRSSISTSLRRAPRGSPPDGCLRQPGALSARRRAPPGGRWAAKPRPRAYVGAPGPAPHVLHSLAHATHARAEPARSRRRYLPPRRGRVSGDSALWVGRARCSRALTGSLRLAADLLVAGTVSVGGVRPQPRAHARGGGARPGVARRSLCAAQPGT
jgi:hypothetical protein